MRCCARARGRAGARRRLRRQPGDRVARRRRRVVFARARRRRRCSSATRTGGGWTDWASLGGNATSGPAAVGYGDVDPTSSSRGTDGAIYQNVLRRRQLVAAGSSLGGFATSAPAATVRRGPQGYVDLAVKGGDNAIWFQTLRPGRGWSRWALARRQPDVGAGAELAVATGSSTSGRAAIDGARQAAGRGPARRGRDWIGARRRASSARRRSSRAPRT